MKSKERPQASEVLVFDEAKEYDQFLKSRGAEYYRSSRAVSISDSDGKLMVAIDRSYYLSGGIIPEQLQALVVHEKIEHTSTSENPHLEATIGEFQYILDNFGPEELKEYHANLCNLIGGRNDIRNQALKTVLEID